MDPAKIYIDKASKFQKEKYELIIVDKSGK
jgi:hypothetical protein